jgi:hypothetical protein
MEGDTTGNIMVRGKTMPASTSWSKYDHSFVAGKDELDIYFNSVGVYYIYQPQLERGSVATDWTESPLDTENKISAAQSTADGADKSVRELAIYLDKTIQQVVNGINGGTLLEQTENGWTMVADGTGNNSREKLAEIAAAVQKLNASCYGDSNGNSGDIVQLKAAMADMTSYIDFGTSDVKDANGNVTGTEPYIQLGTIDPDTREFGEFSLRITDTAIMFMQYDDEIAYVSNQQLYIKKAVIKQELSVGGFVLKQHGTRNNVGFLWKGVYD